VNAQRRVLGSVRFKEAFKRGYKLAGWYNRKLIPPLHPVTLLIMVNITTNDYDPIIAQFVKTFSM